MWTCEDVSRGAGLRTNICTIMIQAWQPCVTTHTNDAAVTCTPCPTSPWRASNSPFLDINIMHQHVTSYTQIVLLHSMYTTCVQTRPQSFLPLHSLYHNQYSLPNHPYHPTPSALLTPPVPHILLSCNHQPYIPHVPSTYPYRPYHTCTICIIRT